MIPLLVMLLAESLIVKGNSPEEWKRRALSAELRAAVAEERLASIAYQQASERTLSAFKAACEAKGIEIDQCKPTASLDGVERKLAVPKSDQKTNTKTP